MYKINAELYQAYDEDFVMIKGLPKWGVPFKSIFVKLEQPLLNMKASDIEKLPKRYRIEAQFLILTK